MITLVDVTWFCFALAQIQVWMRHHPAIFFGKINGNPPPPPISSGIHENAIPVARDETALTGLTPHPSITFLVAVFHRASLSQTTSVFSPWKAFLFPVTLGTDHPRGESALKKLWSLGGALTPGWEGPPRKATGWGSFSNLPPPRALYPRLNVFTICVDSGFLQLGLLPSCTTAGRFVSTLLRHVAAARVLHCQ